MLGYIHQLVRVEVKTYHSIIALGLFRFLLNAQAVALLVKLCYAIALWI